VREQLERRSEGRELVLIRHGQSTANASGVWQGQLDYPLSSLGREQAAETGRSLSGKPIAAVYASPLSRAFETARIVARESGYGGPVVAVEGLQERHGGVLQGKTWEEQERQNPAFARKFLSIPEEERWALVGAETDEEIIARFEEAVRFVLSRPGDGERVVAVSHGGVMRAYLRDLFGDEVLPGKERLPNASVTRLLFPSDGEPRLLELPSADPPLPE
jgi:probable phosphoglycerate mutase